MRFKPMDPEKLAGALEGQEDILSGLVAADEAIYSEARCPWCRGSVCAKEFDPRLYLANNRPIPKYHMRCQDCRCLFSPFTQMVLELGNVARVRGPYDTD